MNKIVQKHVLRRSNALKRIPVTGFENIKSKESRGHISSSNPTAQDLPKFRNEWQQEYRLTSYRPLELRLFCSFLSIYHYTHVLYQFYMFRDDSSFPWMTILFLPELGCAVCATIVTIILTFNCTQLFCFREYEMICLLMITISYLGLLLPTIFSEIGGSRFGFPLQNSSSRVVFDTFPPRRDCNISQNSVDASTDSIGNYCLAKILTGNTSSIYILHSLLPRLFRNLASTAIYASLITSSILFISFLSVGALSSSISALSAVIFQLVSGAGTAFLCYTREKVAKEQFSVAQGIQSASQQSRSLLNTLIPPNVLEKIASHSGGGMLGREIKFSIIMFCSLEPQEELQTASNASQFDLLDEIFSAFDVAVEQFGMFKYQHVSTLHSDWYIVACPRAACPFDDTEQGHAYPENYAQAMVLLAAELQRIAKKFTSWTQAPLGLKVGLHCGPVAGAVIGTHRAFYCLYGDTINTAARMCKTADSSAAAHCTATMAAVVKEYCKDQALVISNGVMHVKGKGEMETFNLTVLPDTIRDLRLSLLQCSSTSHGLRSTSQNPLQRLLTKGKNPRTTALPYCKSALFQKLGHSKINELSPEGQNWVQDSSRRIHHLKAVFTDSQLEGEYRVWQASAIRQWLCIGIVIHLLTITYQWHMILGIGRILGPEKDHVSDLAIVLMTNMVITWILGVVLLIVMHCGVCSASLSGKIFLISKAVHIALSCLVATRSPSLLGWTQSYAFQMALLNNWISTISFRSTATFASVFLAIDLSVAATIGGLSTDYILQSVGLTIAVTWLSRSSNIGLRSSWRRSQVFAAELKRLREILFDILPSTVANDMISVSAKPSAQMRTAAVLQLDICGFTVLSQDKNPLDVAKMVHSLFSEFDAAVQQKGLFKMDTVGDAYIVAGILPANEDVDLVSQDRNNGVCQICQNMLEVSKIMLMKVLESKQKLKPCLQCRIGFAVGTVVCGVLGRLQPRFHVMGPAMRIAENLEQAGKPGSVNISQFVMDILCFSPIYLNTERDAVLSQEEQNQISKSTVPRCEAGTVHRAKADGGHGIQCPVPGSAALETGWTLRFDKYDWKILELQVHSDGKLLKNQNLNISLIEFKNHRVSLGADDKHNIFKDDIFPSKHFKSPNKSEEKSEVHFLSTSRKYSFYRRKRTMSMWESTTFCIQRKNRNSLQGETIPTHYLRESKVDPMSQRRISLKTLSRIHCSSRISSSFLKSYSESRIKLPGIEISSSGNNHSSASCSVDSWPEQAISYAIPSFNKEMFVRHRINSLFTKHGRIADDFSVISSNAVNQRSDCIRQPVTSEISGFRKALTISTDSFQNFWWRSYILALVNYSSIEGFTETILRDESAKSSDEEEVSSNLSISTLREPTRPRWPSKISNSIFSISSKIFSSHRKRKSAKVFEECIIVRRQSA